MTQGQFYYSFLLPVSNKTLLAIHYRYNSKRSYLVADLLWFYVFLMNLPISRYTFCYIFCNISICIHTKRPIFSLTHIEVTK